MKNMILLAATLGAFSAQAQLVKNQVTCEGTVEKTGEKVSVEFCYAKGTSTLDGAIVAGSIIPCFENDVAIVSRFSDGVLTPAFFVIGAKSNYIQTDDSIALTVTAANSDEDLRSDFATVTMTAEMEYSSLEVTLFRPGYRMEYSFEKAKCTREELPVEQAPEETVATGVPGSDVLEGEPVGLPEGEPVPTGVPTIDERGRPVLPPAPQQAPRGRPVVPPPPQK